MEGPSAAENRLRRGRLYDRLTLNEEKGQNEAWK